MLTTKDTLKAIEIGCDSILVSNHGSRQLDSIVVSINTLTECIKATRGVIRIYVDSRIRSRTDIFKALALGADYY